MRFTFLGTGSPVPSLRRSGPAHAVRDEAGRVLLIDCGPGVARQCVGAGIDLAAIEALVVTHLHSDHMSEFAHLATAAWHAGRDRPWRVYAPEPVLEALRGQMRALEGEITLRLAHEARGREDAFQIDAQPLQEKERFSCGGLEIEPFCVDHRPVEPAFGLIFRESGRKLCFSGDTRPVAAMVEAARGADLLVHEVVAFDEAPVAGGRRAETLARVSAYHSTPEEVGRIAHEAGVKALALTHIVPPDADGARLLARLRGTYQGPAILGEDFMEIDLAARQLGSRGFHFAW